MKFRESWSHLGAMWCVFREAKEDDNRSYKYDERADCEECASGKYLFRAASTIAATASAGRDMAATSVEILN